MLKALRDISAANAPEVLVYDDYRCAMILEDLRDFRPLRDDLLRGVVEESVAVSLGRFCAKISTRDAAKQDAYFSEMLGEDDNGAMRAITRDYVFTKPFQEDETNRKIDAASSGLSASRTRGTTRVYWPPSPRRAKPSTTPTTA